MERIPQQVFENRTGIAWCDPNIEYVISLRDMEPSSISEVRIMERDTLGKLLRSIPLESMPHIHPYQDCSFNILHMDPDDLLVGQTFVQRAKYQFLIERFHNILGNGFCVETAIAQCGPMVIYGQDNDGVPAVAFYLPPIVEATGEQRFLIDGIHRNFLVKSIGGTIKTIVVQNVPSPLPCDPIPWSDIQTVDEKPVRQLRFHNLRRQYFRNTKFAGIDG